MKRLATLLLLFLILLPLQARADHDDLVDPVVLMEQNYEAYRDISLDILKKCPPSKCYYLGLGRSPTPIMALLQSFSPGNASNMPLSLSHFFNREIPTEHLDELYKHFDTFLPDLAAMKGKEIVIIDYVSSGKSLINTQHLLQQYAEKKGVKFSIYAFGNPKLVGATIDKAETRGVTSYGFRPDKATEKKFEAMFNAQRTQQLDDAAEFGQYRVGDPNYVPSKKSSSWYIEARNKMNLKALADNNPEVVKMQPVVAEAPLYWNAGAAPSKGKLAALFALVEKAVCGGSK